MPIIDYEAKAKEAEDNLFNSKDISEANKEAVKEFLSGWICRREPNKGQPVSQARRNIFFRQIPHLLKNCDNIKEDIHDKQKIDKIFDKLRKELKNSYLATVINVSLAFVRKLNDDEKPKGFKGVVYLSKDAQKRGLKDTDMITWEDGLKMIKATNSIQFKAIIMTQLEGGLRPSEFIDLKLKDCSKDGKFIFLKVKGKTGEREVPIYRAVPYLWRWIENHPTGNKTDSLWIMESNSKSRKNVKGINAYEYAALSKRVREIGKKAGVNKPLDFYNLRHSATVLLKEQNYPAELAAKRFGHSLKYYLDTYGRESDKQKRGRFKKAEGELKEETEDTKETPILCSICDNVNEPGKEYCEKCGNPLSLKLALEQENKKDEKIAELEGKLDLTRQSVANIEMLLKTQLSALQKQQKAKV